jgi:hypothetical protein
LARMYTERLPANVKRASALRRVPQLDSIHLRSTPGSEGDVCAFELPCDGSPITVESPTGRLMTIVPGDVFLATPGYRAARRLVVGRIPDGGLVPGNSYWVLSESGVVGELISAILEHCTAKGVRRSTFGNLACGGLVE